MANSKEQKRREIKYGNAKEVAEQMANETSSAIKPPKGMKFLSTKVPKSYTFDILPYIVTKGKDQKGGNPHCESGYAWYERIYWVHRRVGPEGKSACCLKTFGKKCPICEEYESKSRNKDLDPEEYSYLKPQKKQLFCVRDLDEPDEDARIKLLDISYFCFGEALTDKINATDHAKGFVYDDFYMLKDGQTLRVTFKEQVKGSMKFNVASNIDLRPRKEDLPESTLDEVANLDEILVELSYGQLKALHEGASDDDDTPPARSGGKARPAQDDDDDWSNPANSRRPKVKEEEEPDEPPKSKARRPEPEDDDDEEPVKPKAKARPAEEEEEEKPRGRGRPPGAKNKPKEEEPEGRQPKIGDWVEHDEFGVCKVVDIVANGEKVNLEDSEGEVKKRVFVTDVTPCAPPKAKGKPAAKPKDEEDDDWDTDDDDDEPQKPAPRKSGR